MMTALVDLADKTCELAVMLAAELRAMEAAQSRRSSQPMNRSQLAIRASQYLRMRRARAGYFPEELFADPAWDLLLDLFVQGVNGHVVSISSACIASAVPPTTALRWIQRLQDAGLVAREGDPEDRRSSSLRLLPAAEDAVAQWVTRTFF